MAYTVSGFSDEYAAEFDAQIRGFNKLGIKFIELRFADGINVADLSETKTEEIVRKLSVSGIKVSAIGSPIGKIGIADDFSEHIRKAEKVFSTAKRLNCRLVRVFSFYVGQRKREDCFTEVVEKMTALISLAEKYGITLCHENEAGIFGEDPDSCHKLLSALNGKLRCVFDMGNFRLGGYDPLFAYEKLKYYVEYFHVKDATVSGEIVPCGEGDAKIEEILKAHYGQKEIFVSLEPHLVAFTGLKALALHDLKQKFCFEDSATAFTYAAENLFKILEKI